MPAGTRLYLDHNAGSPPRPEAVEAAVAAMGAAGNPSSIHAEGREARRIVEAARAEVARLAGARPKGVVFTAGATEANVTALSPVYVAGGRQERFSRLFVSAVEHPSVLRGGRFAPEDVETLPVDGNGVVDLDRLAARVAETTSAGGRALVSVQYANSETGIVQPVAEIAAAVRAAGGRFHCDAVQAAGRRPLDVKALGVDWLSLSAHKIGGLQGAGALVAADPDVMPAVLLAGGGQEANRRSGTEAVAAIAAFGAAASAAIQDLPKVRDTEALRDWLQGALRTISPTMTVIGETTDRLANTLAVALPGLAAETAVIAFDLAGVAISSGSACSSGKVASSHVLKAMGLPADLLRAGIRISLGWNTARADVERFAGIWQGVTGRLGPRSGARA